VAEVQEGSGAAKAGLRSGDSLVAINGVPTPTFIDFKRELEKNENREITIEFYRNGILNTTVAQVDSTGLLGFYPKSPMQIYQPVTISYNFFEAFPAGIKMGIQTLKDYVNQFKYVFTKEGVSSLGGFGTIGSLFPPVWDWHAFWMMTAFLSVILAFMNILPIPGLDGGHVLFLLCEVISGKKPSEKFLEYAQIAGMIFLLALVLYANGMDIIRAIFK
jgi:regulator of sigma E protease